MPLNKKFLALFLFLLISFTSQSQTISFQNKSGQKLFGDNSYSFILLPDLQNMTRYYPLVLSSMFDWIINNKDALNIKCVISLGDLTDSNNLVEYSTVSRQFARLDTANITNVPVIGNHDYDNYQVADRVSNRWDNFFPVSRYENKEWFGGTFNKSTTNMYFKFDAGKHHYLILTLETFPRVEAVEWANNVVQNFPDKEIMLVTHSYLNPDGTRTSATDQFGASTYNLTSLNDANYLWNNLIRISKNINFVFCGHQECYPTSAYSEDTNDYGKIVHQLFFNYQCEENGGNGFLAILNFDMSSGKCQITAFSPYLNSFNTSGVYSITKNETLNTLPAAALQQNYPNPFNPSTTIKYSMPKDGFVTLRIYDLLGKELASLVKEERPAGNYELKFDGSNLSSGIYFYKLQAGDFIQTKKMILLK